MVSPDISLHVWRAADLVTGTHVGTAGTEDGLTHDEDTGLRRYVDPFADDDTAQTFATATWVSPEVHPGHRFTDLVPSWNARTPEGCWIELEARTSEDGVHWSRWWVLGRWAETDATIHATTVRDQEDAHAEVRVEELTATDDTTWQSYQLRVTLLRPTGLGTARPSVSLLAVVVSGGPTVDPATSPRGGTGHGCEVPVPPYSQQLHRGEYPRWANGGASWCSPTSTAMVLGTWGLGPTPEEYAWVEPGYRDRFVDHAVRHTFDHAYHGAGNWAFNAAYAARYGTEAFVTRLPDLADAERYVAAGIPLVASVAFEKEDLPQAGYRTAGHLLVIVGFDERGDVIVNDPASHTIASNDEVRTVYPRAAFEKVWMRSRGIVYVIHPPSVPLPEPPRVVEPVETSRVVEPVETSRVVEPVETTSLPTTR